MHACVRMCWTHSEVIPVASVLGGFSCKHFHVPRFRWLYRRRCVPPAIPRGECPCTTYRSVRVARSPARAWHGPRRDRGSTARPGSPRPRRRPRGTWVTAKYLSFVFTRPTAGRARAPFLRITPLNQDSTSPLQHAACRFYAPTQHRIAVRSAPLADIYAHCGHNRPNDKSVQATAVPKTREASSYQRFTPLMHELRHESYTIVLPEVVCHVGCAWSICLRSCRPCYP